MDVMAEIDNYLQNKSLIAEYIEPLVCEPEGLMCIRLIKPVKITLLDELLEKGVYYFEEPPNETFSNHPIEEVGDLVSNSYLYVENKERSTAENLNFKPVAFYGAVITLGALYLSIALNEIQKQNPSINVTEEVEKQLHEAKQPKTEKPIENENLLTQDIRPVRKCFYNLSKLSNHKFLPQAVFEGKLDISNNVTEPKFITISTDDETALNFKYGALEEAVTNSVTTLMNAGNNKVTLTQIAKYTFNPNGRVTKKQEEQVEEIINRLSSTKVELDFTAEVSNELYKHNGEDISKFTLKGNLINCDQIEIKTKNGKTSTGYLIYRKPLLSIHDERTERLTAIPITVINEINKNININEHSVTVRQYLLKRVSQMKANSKRKKTNYKILYSAIFEAVSPYDELANMQKQRIKKAVKGMLDGMQKTKFIKGYEESKTPNAGIVIKL